MFDREPDVVTPNRVIAWRIERLRDAGFSVGLASALAGDARYDVHALLNLVDQGCSTELSARIVSPLGEAQAMLAAPQGPFNASHGRCVLRPCWLPGRWFIQNLGDRRRRRPGVPDVD